VANKCIGKSGCDSSAGGDDKLGGIVRENVLDMITSFPRNDCTDDNCSGNLDVIPPLSE
jgi:hypothetical protein